jgi:hypothetical protein
MSWAAAGYVLAVVLCFYVLAVVCDDYLCPAIEIFCERFDIPDHVAGELLYSAL